MRTKLLPFLVATLAIILAPTFASAQYAEDYGRRSRPGWYKGLNRGDNLSRYDRGSYRDYDFDDYGREDYRGYDRRESRQFSGPCEVFLNRDNRLVSNKTLMGAAGGWLTTHGILGKRGKQWDAIGIGGGALAGGAWEELSQRSAQRRYAECLARTEAIYQQQREAELKAERAERAAEREFVRESRAATANYGQPQPREDRRERAEEPVNPPSRFVGQKATAGIRVTNVSPATALLIQNNTVTKELGPQQWASVSERPEAILQVEQKWCMADVRQGANGLEVHPRSICTPVQVQ